MHRNPGDSLERKWRGNSTPIIDEGIYSSQMANSTTSLSTESRDILGNGQAMGPRYAGDPPAQEMAAKFKIAKNQSIFRPQMMIIQPRRFRHNLAQPWIMERQREQVVQS